MPCMIYLHFTTALCVKTCSLSLQVPTHTRTWFHCQHMYIHLYPHALCLQAATPEGQQSLLQQIKAQCSGMGAVLPFASTTVIKASSSSQAEIYYGLAKAVDVSDSSCISIINTRVSSQFYSAYSNKSTLVQARQDTTRPH